MNIGSIIKYHRLNQNLTQAVLCNGICSITHLSKIENNNKEADPETLSLLLNRLGLTLLDTEERNHLILNEINDFFKSMIYYDVACTLEIYQSLKEKEEQLNLLENVYTYHIYLFRYYLLLADVQKAQQKKEFLEPFISIFSQYENHLFQYCNGILLIQHGKYSQALKLFITIEKEIALPNILLGEFYYLIGLTYSYLKDFSRSVTYTHKAILEFNKQFNYIRTLHAQTLLAVNYTELGLLQDAHEQFEHLLRNVKMMNRTELLATIHHNFAHLFEKQQDDHQATIHYKKALDHSSNTVQYYMSLCNLTEILIRQGKRDEAKENIKIILQKCTTPNLKKYYFIFKYFDYVLNNQIKRAMNYLEKHVLPFSEKNNLTNEIHTYALLLGDYYANSDKDKAIYYYKKIKSR